RTLLDRHLELARYLGLAPLVVTRPELAADFRRAGAPVLEEARPTGILATLYHARHLLGRPFCWLGGDMLFADPAPLRDLLAAHRQLGSRCSFLYCRGDRFKAKVAFAPAPRVTVTREGAHAFSIPNFLVQSPEMFPYMAADPNGNFLQAAIAAGEPILYREYAGPVFEIDTPRDLAEARAHFAGCELAER